MLPKLICAFLFFALAYAEITQITEIKDTKPQAILTETELNSVISKLEGATALTTSKAVNLYNTFRSQVDTLTFNGLKNLDLEPLGSALRYAYLLLPYIDLPTQSALNNPEIAKMLGYYSIVATTNLYPPQAYTKACVKLYNFREAIDPLFYTKADQQLIDFAEENGLIDNLDASLIPEEVKKYIRDNMQDMLGRLSSFTSVLSKDQKLMEDLSNKHELFQASTERFFVYSNLFLFAIANSVGGSYTDLQVMQQVCTNFAYREFVDNQIVPGFTGEKYWLYLQNLFKLSSVESVSTSLIAVSAFLYFYAL